MWKLANLEFGHENHPKETAVTTYFHYPDKRQCKSAIYVVVDFAAMDKFLVQGRENANKIDNMVFL